MDFIRHHADDDVRQLALRGTKDPEVDLPFALDQIAGRQTARRKLPSWAATEGIVYPPHLSMEQCSSEQTARYKAGMAGRGHRLVDLTGGFGVDFSVMAQGFAEAVYVERQASLCEIADRNFCLLGLRQAAVVCGDGTDYLQTMPPADLIYIDPARRDAHGGRTYGIADCTPDVLSIRDLLLEKAERVIIKLSPMLDWRKAVADLGPQYVREVHIVSVANECKELLLLLGKGESFRLFCVNDDTGFEAYGAYGTNGADGANGTNGANGADGADGAYRTYRTYGTYGTYRAYGAYGFHPHFLYSPNASIMKAGCFEEVAARFSLYQLAQNSHLFVSDKLVEDFPGRVFQIDAVTTMNKRELRQHLQGMTQANITVRNFPLSVAELRKRLKLSEGGSTYIFATTLADGDKVLLICSRG